MSKFQIITFVVIGVIVAVALLAFMGVIPTPGKDKEKFTELTLWGTLAKEDFGRLIDMLNSENAKIFKINYIEKNPENYKEELAGAFLSGNAPDMWMITQDMIWEYKDKVEIIPYTSYSTKQFTDTFVQEGELLLTKDGIIGIPIFIEPMVLFWNRDLFSSSGIAQAPKYWDEVVSYVPRLTKIDSAGNIFSSGIAMGEFKNINNAKDIISLLVLQKNNKIVDLNERKILWNEGANDRTNDAEDALRFFTDFSDPKKQVYSWNRSLKNSLDKFVNGSLAMYFGFASEANEILEKNTHLNFGIISVPQIRPREGSVGISSTFGRMQGIVFSRVSPNKSAAFSAVFKILDEKLLRQFADSYFIMPSTRSVLNQGPEQKNKPFLEVFYASALQSRAWLEPDYNKVSEIFKDMVESVSSGEKKVSEAVSDATYKLQELIR